MRGIYLKNLRCPYSFGSIIFLELPYCLIPAVCLSWLQIHPAGKTLRSRQGKSDHCPLPFFTF